MYNRYAHTDFGRYAPPANAHCGSAEQNGSGKFCEHPHPPQHKQKPSESAHFAGEMFKSLFPEWLEVSDIFLLLLLFFLYIESEDEEFLIMLIVIGYSIFKKR